MKTILLLLVGLMLSPAAMSGPDVPDPIPARDTIINMDSMNLAILIVDFVTYQFESVNVSYYTKCDNYCDTDSLPIRMYFDNHWDYAHVYFYYKFDNSLLFKGGTTWMGYGQITYPTPFYPAQNYPYVAASIPLPADAEYYNATIGGAGNYCPWDEYVQRANTAWHSVDSLEITNLFASKPFRVGLFGYSRTEGEFDPENADWIIFLYRGNHYPVSSGIKSEIKSFKLFPNPCNGHFSFTSQSEPQRMEVFSLLGEKLNDISISVSKQIDLGYLPNGVYLIKSSFGSDTRVSKISIIH